MYKSLLKNASLYSISSLISRGFSFITVPIYTRLLSPADYGAYDLLSNMVLLVVLLMGCQLDHALARFYHDAADDDERKTISSSILLFTVFLFVPFLFAVEPVSAWLANDWLNHQVNVITVEITFVLIWTQAVYVIANNQLNYAFKTKEFAICSITSTVFGVTLSLLFVAHFGLGVAGLLLGQTVGTFLAMLLSLFFGRAYFAWTFSSSQLAQMLKYSLPLVPGALAFYLMQYVDRYALNHFVGIAEVGLYGIGARVAMLINLFLSGFQGAWTPVVMSSYREAGARRHFKTVFNYYLFAVLMVLVGLSLFGEEILLLLTNKNFSQGFVVIPLLLLSAILSSITHYFTYGIQIAKKSGLRMMLNLAGLAINSGLVYWLAPRYGMIGAALATALSFVFMSVVGMAISQHFYAVPYRWRRILTASLFAIAVSNAVLLADCEINLQTELLKAAAALFALLFLAKLLAIKLEPSRLRQAKAGMAILPTES